MIDENLKRIRETINEHTNSPIIIVGVTKKQPIEKIEQAIQLGLNHLGVNYAQEGETLLNHFKGKKIYWHFIGHIQSRKVKFLSSYHFIESIDRAKVAELLNQYAVEQEKSSDILIEINIGNEPQKSGVPLEKLDEFIYWTKTLSRLNVVGFMCMPPSIAPPSGRAPYFEKMRNIFERYKTPFNLKYLSMGTTEDYVFALKAGANIVRLGTLLFGKRL